MFIATDIGNSSISIGYFTKIGLIVQKMDTKPIMNVNNYCANINDFLLKNNIEKKLFSVIISSVVSGYSEVFKEVFKRLSDNGTIEIITVNHRIKTGLDLRIKVPEELGTDRIANAVGACELYKPPVAVVDFGTATTITAVDVNAQYIGGSIMPGLGLMNEMLDRETSKLTKISLEPPQFATGKSTSECISSGIFYGTGGAVERVLDEIEKEANCKFKVVLTGGFAPKVDRFINRPHDINLNLTLEGLRIIYEKNRHA
jgi:type III pantothenate kinase